jgi:hypothetical protein
LVNPLNPDAGDTPVPADPVAREVARRAAAVMWRAVPYFHLRYGARGHRFALSDGAWLTMLGAMPPPVRLDQINWLARVLSPRGVPSWLLELQLAATRRCGRRARWPDADSLAEGEELLRSRRQGVLDERVFADLEARFVRRAAAGRLALGSGKLIAAAYVDAALGLCASADFVVEWLRQAGPFGPGWRAAVEECSAAAAAELRRR